MVQTKEVKLTEDTFSISQFMAIEGLKIKAALISLLSDSVPVLFADVKSLAGVLDVDIGKKGVSAALGKLMARMDDNTVAFILRVVKSSSARVNNEELTEEKINIHFAGNYVQLYKLVWKILDFNYGADFFGEGGIGTIMEAAFKEQVKESTTKPSTKDS